MTEKKDFLIKNLGSNIAKSCANILAESDTIKRLREVIANCTAEKLALKAENAALRERLSKAVELPPGDRVWYIAEDEEGQESYIIPKPTSSLTVEELKYEMDKKYFSTREAAEARLEELKGGMV